MVTLTRSQPPRELWRVEMVEQKTEGGLVFFEYALREPDAEPFILNNHKAQIRTNHQRIRLDEQGRMLHVSGVAVPDDEIEDFLAKDERAYRWVDRDRSGRWRDDRGRVLAPFLFAAPPWKPGADEELDPQWQRERYILPLDDQVQDAIERYMRTAERKQWTGDRRGTTLNLQVSTGDDDAFEVSGTVTLNGTNLTPDSVVEWWGTRFNNVTIAGGSTIDEAIYTIAINGTGNDEPWHKVYADDADDSAAFTTGSNDISGRTATTAVNNWDVADLGVSGAGFQEWGCASAGGSGADIKAIIQEVVDRGGWASGNDLSLIVTQIGPSSDFNRDLFIRAYETDSALAAKLDITYTEGGGGPTEVPLAGNQPAASGALTPLRLKALAGAQPAPSGALTPLFTSKHLTGAQPAPSGTVQSKRDAEVAGEQAAPSGTVAADLVLQHETLTGNQPAPSGELAVKLAKDLAGNQPAPSGALAALFSEKHLAGNQPAPSGALAIDQILRHIALAGNQPAPSGTITVADVSVRLEGNQGAPSGALAIKYRIALSGNQPAPSGALAALFASKNLVGNQPPPSGVLVIDQILRHISLAGAQAAPSGTVTPVRLIALGGEQGAPSGDLAVLVTSALAGNQPAPSGDIALRFFAVLEGNQPAPSGAIVDVPLVALAGNQPAPSGALTPVPLIALAGNQPAPAGELIGLFTAKHLAGEQAAPSGFLVGLHIVVHIAGNQPGPTGRVFTPITIGYVIPPAGFVITEIAPPSGFAIDANRPPPGLGRYAEQPPFGGGIG